MVFTILLLIVFIAFAVYRYKAYKAQREVAAMAADAQAYISGEVVLLLQRYKAILKNQIPIAEKDDQEIQQKIKQISHMYCASDSEATVREYLSLAQQNIALVNIKLDHYAPRSEIQETAEGENVDEFEALK